MERTSLLDRPHHDGSLLEVDGEYAVVRLWAAPGTADRVILRYVHDGEAGVFTAEPDGEEWWVARFPLTGSRTNYRWLLWGGEAGYAWLNGTGLHHHDIPDADDFVHAPAAGGPDWHLTSVVYQIFPDRFASSGVEADVPAWAVPRQWDVLPEGRTRNTAFEYFGGDLRGIEQHLDHIEALGANVIYLTPFFPAGSTHRYDSTTFDEVDPLLGGNDALASLTAAAHARGIRVIGDITPNHTGNNHEWFRAAQADPGAPERELYYFDDSLPHGYVSWWGIPVLPKLNHESPELARRLAEVIQKWMREPYCLDGWRVDVANMTGRLAGTDVAHEVARRIRAAAEEVNPDALIVAEHAHDFRADVQGGGWQGTMNYAGFMRPTWQWLHGELPDELRTTFWGFPVGLPQVDGAQAAATMQAFRAGVPWESILHSWVLLDSHDSARWQTVAGSPERQLVGIGLQMTTPGVPMVYAGDELGLEGAWGEDARRTMPWGAEPGELFERYRELIALRRGSETLARGGIRCAAVTGDAIAYLREHGDERLLCLAARSAHEPIRLALGTNGAETLYGEDISFEGTDAVLPGGGPAFHIWRIS